MEKYYYTKAVKSTPFEETLMLELPKELFRKIISINVTEYSNEDLLEDDNIEIVTEDVLISDELDLIANAINNYSSTHPLVARYGIEVSVMDPAASYGNTMVKKFASNNISKGKHMTAIEYEGSTKAITGHILDKYQTMIVNMLTGSLTEVYANLAAITPDELISLDEKEEFMRRLEIYLGI